MKKYWSLAALSRLFILSLDICCVLVSFLVASLGLFNFTFPLNIYNSYLFTLLWVLALRIVFFCVFSIYSNTINFSIIQHTKRVFYAVSGSSAVLLVMNLTNLNLLDSNYTNSLNITIILTDFVLLVFLMIMYRVFIKYGYNAFISNKNQKNQFLIPNNTHIPTLIFGAGTSGIGTKNCISQQNILELQIIAFLDDNPSISGQTIEGIRIYNTQQQFDELVRKHKIKNVIISIPNIENKRKQAFIDMCLEANLRVMIVPPQSKWVGGKLDANQIRTIGIDDLLERVPIVLDSINISKQIYNKTIMITGAAGSIGSEIARQLLGFEPLSLMLIDQAETPLVELILEIQEQYNYKNLTGLVADVSQRQRMIWIFEHHKPDIIFHAAAYKHVPIMEENPYEAIKANILGTKNLADMAVKYGVSRFVMISTDKAVNPTNVMGASKRIAEIYIQALNDTLSAGDTRFVTTRFGNVIGSNGSVIPRFKKQIAAGGPVSVTNSEISRYFMTIHEACQLVLEAGAMGEGGEIFIFDMGKAIKILDLANKMIKLSGLLPEKDIKIRFTGLRPGEKIEEELLSKSEQILPTHNHKIMIAKVRKYGFEQVNQQISTLTDMLALANFDEKTAVAHMKTIVPEFVSHNSIYNQLDLPLAKPA